MRVAVIGAGAAGLVTARELRRAGHEAVLFESQSGIGGTWRYEERKGVHGSMYASLRTNLPTRLMAFRDLPFEGPTARADGLWFCGHRDVQAYLERFAATFELEPSLRLGVKVDHAAPRGDGWRLRLGDGAIEDVGALAVCNGHYSVPRLPVWPGRFAGATSHSHDYRRPAPFADQRVVILGARSSGTDLSREIAEVAAEVHLCAREHDARRSLGPNLVAEPAIERLGPGRRVVLADGRALEDVDHLLFCTGYRYAFPFLEPGWVDEDGVGPLYLDLVPPRAPRLAFVGLPFAVVPFPLMQAQARWWARMLAGTVAAPSTAEMAREAEQRLARLAADGVPRRHWMRYGERQFDYVNALLQRVGEPPLPDWFAPLYRATREAKQRDPAGYRDAPW